MNMHFGFEGFFCALNYYTNNQLFKEMNTGKISGISVLLKLRFMQKLVFIIYLKHLYFKHKDSKTEN